MFTICCTSKILKRTKLHPESSTPLPTTALGDWYANIIYINKRQYLLFVSENSRLAVITPAKDARLLAYHLTQHLLNLLIHLDIPSEWIEAELREMADVHIARTHSRSVLGTMNDFKFQIEWIMDDPVEVSLLQAAKELSSCPVGPLKYHFPGEEARELLMKRYS